MLYISGYEVLIIIVVFATITFGPPLAAWALVIVRRWKERRHKA